MAMTASGMGGRLTRKKDPSAGSSVITVAFPSLNFLNVCCAAATQSCRVTNAWDGTHGVPSLSTPLIIHITHAHSAEADVVKVVRHSSESRTTRRRRVLIEPPVPLVSGMDFDALLCP